MFIPNKMTNCTFINSENDFKMRKQYKYTRFLVCYNKCLPCLYLVIHSINEYNDGHFIAGIEKGITISLIMFVVLIMLDKILKNWKHYVVTSKKIKQDNSIQTMFVVINS